MDNNTLLDNNLLDNNIELDNNDDDLENKPVNAVEVKRRGSRTKPLPLAEKLDEVKNFGRQIPPLTKGNEGKYLNSLLLCYQSWFKQSLEAKGSFDEIAHKIEKLGHTRSMRVRIHYFFLLVLLLILNILIGSF